MPAAQATPLSYRVIRELGSRAEPSVAAFRTPHELVVFQRFVRKQSGSDPGLVTAEVMALLLRDARALVKSWHPNLARVRHVDLIGSELFVATELVEGSTLEDLLALGPIEMPTLLRIFLDVLSGLQGLHALRDGMNAPLDAMHGELGPANVVVGRDGVARIVNIFRPRPVRTSAKSESLGYAAPEALDGVGTSDPRSDLHAVGVMLWEALAGRRLRTETDPASLLLAQREGEIPKIEADDALLAIAMRAMAFDPASRFRSAAEMAAEIRLQNVASGAVVAQVVNARALDRIRERRVELDPAGSGTRHRTASPPSMDTIPEVEPEGARGTLPDPPRRMPPPASPAWGRALLNAPPPASVPALRSKPPSITPTPAVAAAPAPPPSPRVVPEPPRRVMIPTPSAISATMPPPAPRAARSRAVPLVVAAGLAIAVAIGAASLVRSSDKPAATLAMPSFEPEGEIAKEPAPAKEPALPPPLETTDVKESKESKEPSLPPRAPVVSSASAKPKPPPPPTPAAKPTNKKAYEPSGI